MNAFTQLKQMKSKELSKDQIKQAHKEVVAENSKGKTR